MNKMPEALQYLFEEAELYEMAKSLCQNKKNGKRIITDVSISKVPYVIFPGIDNSKNLIIHELAEHLLQLSKNQHNSNEIAITYDLSENDDIENGITEILKKVGICFGSENETNLFSDTKTMSIINRAKSIAIVNLHNHPSCDTFSVQDISIFLKESALKLMIVLGNNGELYYLSKNLNKYDYKQCRDYLINATKTIAPDAYKNTQKFLTYSEMKDIATLFLKNCNKFGIDYRHILGSDKSLLEQKELRKKNQEEEQYEADRDDY